MDRKKKYFFKLLIQEVSPTDRPGLSRSNQEEQRGERGGPRGGGRLRLHDQ